MTTRRKCLPKTGRCYYCGAPCEYRFCNHNHNASYYRRLRREQVKQQPRQVLPLTLDERIEQIVARAAANGTLGWATLAPERR